MTKKEAVSLLEGEIIRCRMAPKINGCPMTEDWQRTIEVCEIAIAAIKAQEERRWIPVMERTPENIGLYLVIEKHWLDGSLGIKIAKWNTTDWFTADRKSKEITQRVTHWMPLPEIPKKRVVQNEM